MNRIIFLGAGNMAYAILGGLLKSGVDAADCRAIDPSAQAQTNMQNLGIQCSELWPDDFDADAVVLAVKPQLMKDVLNTHGGELEGRLVISIAAGVSVDQIRQWSGQPDARVVRCMPNTPALVGQGLSGLYLTDNCSTADRSSAVRLFETCGQVLVLNQEDQINAITAISGSGPGYVFYWMEALAQAARDLGFDDASADLLVRQTLLGSATLASQSTEALSTLRERVTSKGGTTFAGLEAMRAAQVGPGIVQGVQAAMARAIELQNGS